MNPKSRLLSDKTLVTAVNDIVDTSAFQKAADAALLELVSQLPDTVDSEKGAAFYNRVVGARQFLATLTGIATKPRPVLVPQTSANLDHKA